MPDRPPLRVLFDRTWAMLVVALALRVAALVALGDPCGISGKETSWDWGYEQAAIAQADSLAPCGDGILPLVRSPWRAS